MKDADDVHRAVIPSFEHAQMMPGSYPPELVDGPDARRVIDSRDQISRDVLNVTFRLIHAPVVCRVEPDFREIPLGGRAQNEADHAAPL